MAITKDMLIAEALQQENSEAIAEKIGRASCRERV